MNDKKKILIVEDEVFLIDLYRIKFEREGYEVITAMDGQTGLEAAKKDKPDIILLDIVMPVMNGFEVLEALKKDDTTKDIKVYILSNLGQSDEIQQGLDKGADGYLIKANITPGELTDYVAKVLKVSKNNKKDSSSAGAGKDNSAKDDDEEQRGDILLIEDEKDIVDMYKTSLEKVGYQVSIAKNGAWGLKQAQEKEFDLIIMDIVMPAMDGLGFLKKLKEGSKNHEIPIIVLSNSAQETDIQEAKRCGADCYLLKSQITPSKLAEEIAKLVD
ncbi:response regulator [Patescibacteria group bacterium]